MGDEIVGYALARAAKRRGFNEYTKGGYSKGGEYIEYFDHCEYTNLCLESEWIKDNFPQRFAAPTQSLLQRWVREKHGLHVEVMLNNQIHPEPKAVYNFIVISYSCNVINYNVTSNEVYATYEQALEAGLAAALKEIK